MWKALLRTYDHLILGQRTRTFFFFLVEELGLFLFLFIFVEELGLFLFLILICL